MISVAPRTYMLFHMSAMIMSADCNKNDAHDLEKQTQASENEEKHHKQLQKKSKLLKDVNK